MNIRNFVVSRICSHLLIFNISNAEEGTHRELTERKGMYYRLVKNQLELGS